MGANRPHRKPVSDKDTLVAKALTKAEECEKVGDVAGAQRWLKWAIIAEQEAK